MPIASKNVKCTRKTPTSAPPPGEGNWPIRMRKTLIWRELCMRTGQMARTLPVFGNFATFTFFKRRRSKEDVQKKTGAKLVHNGIVGRNVGRHLLFCSQISPHNAIRDKFGARLSMNFGKAHGYHKRRYTQRTYMWVAAWVAEHINVY